MVYGPPRFRGRGGVAGSRGTGEEDDLYERIAEKSAAKNWPSKLPGNKLTVVGQSGAFRQSLGSQTIFLNN